MAPIDLEASRSKLKVTLTFTFKPCSTNNLKKLGPTVPILGREDGHDH